jgi:hypothetical protein
MKLVLARTTAGAALFVACSDDSGIGSGSFGTGSAADDSSSAAATGPADTGESADASASADASSDDGQKFDVGPADTGPADRCSVGDMDAPGPCRAQAPADSFAPAVQWTWTSVQHPYSVVIPLVANLTDDNGDDSIDLCDVPDVVVLAYGCPTYCSDARLYVLDGATGAEHFMIDMPLKNAATPALGDVDGDGLPEIVAVEGGGKLVMFEHDGSLAWIGAAIGDLGLGAIALADLDNDADVEIIHNSYLISDHEGHGIVHLGEGLIDGPMTPTAADLDGDGDLEIVRGATAWHHDGTLYYQNDELGFAASDHAQVANLDDDDDPEIVVSGGRGLWVLEHDGTTKLAELAPTGEPLADWGRPVTIHDFDGDGPVELAVKSDLYYSVLESDGTLVWSAPVLEGSFGSGGTAFDFLGDGRAEAIYADERTLFVFDEVGAPLLQVARTSFTAIEYPVVADIDNDGSAEIVVVSNRNQYGEAPSPTVQVVRDEDDRWIPARRIWNQHTYHVTNVREDGTIPQFEPRHWQQLNTFRTNAQVEGGSVCRPEG